MTDAAAPNNDLITDPLSLTTGGLPYPESTGPLNQGANDIKALALALQSRGGGAFTQSGRTSVSVAAGNATLTFPVAFKTGTVPLVVTSGTYGNGSDSISDACLVMPRNVAANTFTVVAYVITTSQWYTGPLLVNWIAVGVAP